VKKLLLPPLLPVDVLEADDAVPDELSLSPAWSFPLPPPERPGTVLEEEGVAVPVTEGSAADMFVPVPKNDLRIVGSFPSTTVSFVAAVLLYVYETPVLVPGADVALKQDTCTDSTVA